MKFFLIVEGPGKYNYIKRVLSMSDCPLCNLERKTHWYRQEKDYVICGCLTCRTPMYVWRHHTFPTEEQIKIMLDDAKENFPNNIIDMNMRSIQNHFHFHLRKM